MALIAKEQKIERTDLRIKIDQKLKTDIDAYCSWAGIEDLNHFISEAVKIVLAKDKDWKNYNI
jgi:hypothetical protein